MIEVNKTLSNIFSTTLNNKLRNEKFNDYMLFYYLIIDKFYFYNYIFSYIERNHKIKSNRKLVNKLIKVSDYITKNAIRGKANYIF